MRQHFWWKYGPDWMTFCALSFECEPSVKPHLWRNHKPGPFRPRGHISEELTSAAQRHRESKLQHDSGVNIPLISWTQSDDEPEVMTSHNLEAVTFYVNPLQKTGLCSKIGQ